MSRLMVPLSLSRCNKTVFGVVIYKNLGSLIITSIISNELNHLINAFFASSVMVDLPIMGIDDSVNVEDFEQFFQDEIFVDYFNTFLSLPVRITLLF